MEIAEHNVTPKPEIQAIQVGLFRAENGQGIHCQRDPVDQATIASIAVTVAPESGSTAPTMPILLAAPVQFE